MPRFFVGHCARFIPFLVKLAYQCLGVNVLYVLAYIRRRIEKIQLLQSERR